MTGSDTSGSLNPIKRFNDLYSSLLLTDGTAHRLSRIESSLRSLTYFVPGQSLSSESLYTGLNLLSLYHDALLSRTSSNSGSSLSLSGTSPHTRYTKWWIQQSRLYKAIARLLSVLSYTQLMLEMAARKYRGEKGRWRVVLGLESLKAVLRLILLRLTHQRTVLQPSIPEREIDPASLPTSTDASTSNDLSDASSLSSQDAWHAKRTGVQIPTIASMRSSSDSGTFIRVESEIQSFLQKKVLSLDSVRKPYQLVRKRQGLDAVAEIAWILRPVVYVLALKRFGKKNYYPFLLSLALEYYSYTSLSSSLSASARTGNAVSSVEKRELDKRQRAFWYYLLRGPLWELWTKPRMDGFIDRWKDNRWGVGLAAALVNDYKELIDDYYYYSST